MVKSEIGQFTRQEIYAQAKAVRNTLELAPERSQQLARCFPLTQYTEVIFTGCGSSYHLAQGAAFAWARSTGARCHAHPSSELAHFPSSYLKDDSHPLVFALSRSGGTDETVLAIETLRSRYQATTIALTGETESEVGRLTDVHLVFHECREHSVVTTQAFTCIWLGLLLIADSCSGSRLIDSITSLPEVVETSLMGSELAVRPLAEDETADSFIFLGSGPFFPLVAEAALKMAEMALTHSVFYHTLEFRHGPKVVLSPRSRVVVFPAEVERPYIGTLLAEIEETGARALIVSDQPVATRSEQLNLRSGFPELVQPVLFAHVVQQLAFWRALMRGFDPDTPPHLVRTVKLAQDS
jgi:glucosamine--fructose-6-phosphate aminotransferase (isomerizing)